MKNLEEADADRRQGLLAENALSLQLVSAFAGDRPLTDAEKNRIGELQTIRGQVFFSDLLYSVSHQYFSPEVAEDLWTNPTCATGGRVNAQVADNEIRHIKGLPYRAGMDFV